MWLSCPLQLSNAEKLTKFEAARVAKEYELRNGSRSYRLSRLLDGTNVVLFDFYDH